MAVTETLKQNSDFHRAYGRGQSAVSPVLVTYALPNKTGSCRVGITASKKIGTAVERNRCRRIIKAAFSSLSSECAGGQDLVFVARFKTKNAKMQDVAAVMREHLVSLGVIRTD